MSPDSDWQETVGNLKTEGKDISREELSAYLENPYIKSATEEKIVPDDSFFHAAYPLLEAGIDKVLSTFEMNPEHFSPRQKTYFIGRMEKSASSGERGHDPSVINDTAIRIMMARMSVMNGLVEKKLRDIGARIKEMTPPERKEICLMVRGFPKDPGGIFTTGHILFLAGISRNSYYCYIGKESYGLAVSTRDALDEADVRQAFEYKGYKKGVRMVYMLIPILTGRKIGIDRVRRIMGKYGMDCGVRKANTSRQAAAERLAKYTKDDLLKRMFRLHRPNEVRITDVTYLEYGEDQKAYGSALMDPVTDMLIAFVVSDSNDLELAKETLRMMDSHPCLDGGIFHSDQGSLYLSPEFQKEVEKMGLRQSMSKRGNCWDNAPMESFFGHFKDECSYEGCKTTDELRKTIEDYAWYYNHERGMWGRKHLTPVKYEEYLLSLSEEAFDEYLETEKKKYDDMKEKAVKKAKKRYKTLGV